MKILKPQIGRVLSASALILALLGPTTHSLTVYALAPTGSSNSSNPSSSSDADNTVTPASVAVANPYGLADGTYSMSYEFHKFNTDQVSVMQDYVVNPGKLIVKDGKMQVQITLKQSKETTAFKIEQNGSLQSAEVVAVDEQNNTRTVQFEVQDLTAKVKAWVKIYWQINDSFLYDHEYDVDLTFDKATLKAIATEPAATPPPPAQEAKPAASFADLTGHWAKEAVEQAVALQIVNGYEDGTFRPEGEINREEFAVLLSRALKLAPGTTALSFADEATISAWAKPHLAAAVDSGLIGGYEDGTFRADRKISRTELAVIAVRALKLPVATGAKLDFADADQVPSWAQAEVATAVQANLIGGRDGDVFAPNESATRAEAVSTVMALVKNVQSASKE